MNVLLINSSYRKNGNTYKLCSLINEYYLTYSISIIIINLAEYKINQCCGCRLCFDKGEMACPHKDDVLSIYSIMKLSDLIIWASPVYVEDVNGLLKNFIDRLAFNSHRPSLFNQSCFVYINSGSGSSNHSISTIERACQTWGMKLAGHNKFVLGANMNKKEISNTYGIKLQKDITKTIRKIKIFRKPSFIQILTFYIQKWYYLNKIDKECFDYSYWKSMGWLETDAFYYNNIKIWFLTKVSSKIIGNLIIKVMLN